MSIVVHLDSDNQFLPLIFIFTESFKWFRIFIFFI